MGIFIKNKTKRVQKDGDKQQELINTNTNKSLIGEEIPIIEKKAIKKGFGVKKEIVKEPVKSTINSVKIDKEEKKPVVLFENKTENAESKTILLTAKPTSRNSTFDKIITPEIKPKSKLEIAEANNKTVSDIYEKGKKNLKVIQNKNNKYYNFVFGKGVLTQNDINLVNKKLNDELKRVKSDISTMDLFFFKSFIKNKTIALVANSSDLLKRKSGLEIDSHDIVIRFNSYNISKEHTGEKTTIHASVYLQNENLEKFVPIRFILSNNISNWGKKVSNLNKFKQGTILKYNHHTVLPYNFKDDEPTTTGFATLIFLLKIGGYEKINMYGFDFYQDGNDSIFRTPNGMDLPISTVHDYLFEKEFMMEYSYEYDDKKNLITFYDYSAF